MKKILTLLASLVILSGCATQNDALKGFMGVSTREIEEYRKDATVKVFDNDYDTCYKKIEKFLKTMPGIVIYTQDAGMIAVYYSNPNQTPVGIFFTAVDPTHTKVEISSFVVPAKEWVAKNVFSETVLPPNNGVMAFKKGS